MKRSNSHQSLKMKRIKLDTVMNEKDRLKSAFVGACEAGDEKIVEMLLPWVKKNAVRHVNCSDRMGVTGLMVALMADQYEVGGLLLDLPEIGRICSKTDDNDPIICTRATCTRLDQGRSRRQRSNNLCPSHLHLIETEAQPRSRSGAGGEDTDYWIFVRGFCRGPIWCRWRGIRLLDCCQRFLNRYTFC